MGKSLIIKGALILTLANIITRVLGFIYRIYMSNLIGAEGMGLYSLIMPIYMLAWSLSSSGFSTTISKLVAEYNCKNQMGNIKRILSICIILSSSIACLFGITIYIFSDYIALNILKNENTLLSLHIMCISFPFMAIGSCIRGYFLGMQEAKIPAISQVLEQLARMISIYFLSGLFIPLGLSYACGVGVIGMCIGEIFSFLYVLMVYNTRVTKNIKPNISTIKSTYLILAMTLPLTANRVLGSLLSSIENILIPIKLAEFGYSSSESMALYGQLEGMAMPLIMFPSSLLTSLAIAIVPAISEALAKKNLISIKNTISKTFLITSFIGIGSAGVFITFCNQLGLTIYSQTDIGWQLFYLGFLCPFIYYNVVLSGILNGLGEQMLIFKNCLLASVINISIIYFLIPKYGLIAFIVGCFISLVLVNSISLIRLKKRLSFNIDILNSIVKPCLCIFISSFISRFIYNFILSYTGNILALIISLAFLGLSYLILLILSGAINKNILKIK